MTKQATAKSTVLIVDDDSEFLCELSTALQRDFEVVTASTSAEARQRADEPNVHLAVLDVRLRSTDPSDKEGMKLLEALRQRCPDLPIVMMTSYPDIDQALEAVKKGAIDFIQKETLEPRDFRNRLKNALRLARSEQRSAELEEELRRFRPSEFVGEDPKLDAVRRQIQIAAEDGQCVVLVLGETGTGKDLVARAIHRESTRGDKPYVAVNCAAIPEALLESELFGHEKGAFTGADRQRIGRFEECSGGTLFLDEIGDMSLLLQSKVLRLLQEQRFERVGGNHTIQTDVQIIAATHRDLDQMVTSGQFRRDLYYRLKVWEIRLPPLRERKGDIPLLADHFLSALRSQGRTQIAGIDPNAIACLGRHPLPGNVRELENSIERAVLNAKMHRHNLIMLDDLPLEIVRPPITDRKPLEVSFPEDGICLEEELARMELTCIDEALRRTGGRKEDAGKLLRLNDRYALRRHVRRIRDDFPDLLTAFPLVDEAYKSGSDSD